MRPHLKCCALAFIAIAVPAAAAAQSACPTAVVSNDPVVGALQGLTPMLAQAQCAGPALPGDVAREHEYDPEIPTHLQRSFELRRERAPMASVTTSNWVVERVFGSTRAGPSLFGDELSSALVVGVLATQLLTDLDLLGRRGASVFDTVSWLTINALAHGIAQSLVTATTGLGDDGASDDAAALDPLSPECQDDSNLPECRGGLQPSRRATLGFTSASLSCLHYQMEGGDPTACIGTVAMSLALGAVQALGEDHELEDIALSAGLGFLSGYLFPLAAHEGLALTNSSGPRSENQSDFRAWISPTVSTSGLGLRAAGTF